MTGLMHTPKSFIDIPVGQFLKKRPLIKVKPGGLGSTQRPTLLFNVNGLGHENETEADIYLYYNKYIVEQNFYTKYFYK
jgi:hypothetical protein